MAFRNIGIPVPSAETAATTNSTLVVAQRASLYGLILRNASASTLYFKFYDKATAPTVGTDTPVMVIAIPTATSINYTFPYPVGFNNGIGYGITANPADSDTTAIAANDIVGINVFYNVV